MYCLLALTAVLGLAIFAASLYFERGAVLRRKMRAVPATSIALAKEGHRVRLTGLPTAEPLYAPLSGKPCVHYVVVVEELRILQKHNIWKIRASEEQWVDFVLTDASGTVPVSTEHSKSAAIFRSAKNGAFALDPPSVQAFLSRQAAKGIRIPSLPHRKIRMTEAILEVGSTITVVGKMVNGRLQGAPGQELLATDDIEFR